MDIVVVNVRLKGRVNCFSNYFEQVAGRPTCRCQWCPYRKQHHVVECCYLWVKARLLSLSLLCHTLYVNFAALYELEMKYFIPVMISVQMKIEMNTGIVRMI